VARLTAMLDDFLDLARTESNRLVIRPTRLDVAGLFSEATDVYEPLAKQHGLRLEATSPQGLQVLADERRLLQVIANLVSNAIRYSPPGGTIRLTAIETQDDVEFHVQDQGRGLSAEQIGRLFRPFVQVHDAPGNSKGSGLGLYLSKARVRVAAARGGGGRDGRLLRRPRVHRVERWRAFVAEGHHGRAPGGIPVAHPDHTPFPA